MNRIILLKAFDRFVGAGLVRLFAKPRKREAGSINSFLVIRPGGIGDAVLLAPMLMLLKSAYPKADLAVLAERRNAAVFELVPSVDRVMRYDVPCELLTALSGCYDAVIDTEQSHRLSAIIARLTGAPMTVGFATNEREKLFSCLVAYAHETYEIESFLDMLSPFDIGVHFAGPPFLSLPHEVVRWGRQLLKKLEIPGFIAIFPGASIDERKWGVKNYLQLVQRLSNRGIETVVVGGSEDALSGKEIVSGNGGLSLAGQTSLAETAAIVAQSSLLVSGDSGILHIAVGLGVPTVSLFGPGRAKKWAPHGDNHIVINKNLPCSPCTTFGYTPRCPINARCMAEITVDEVEEAVLTLLSRKNFDVDQQKP